jgi:hypothetical protein
VRLPHRLVPLQKRCRHPLDRGGVFRSLGALIRNASCTTCSRYSSQPLSVRRASTRASRVSYWSQYQSRSELNRARRSYLSRARPSNSCHRWTRCGGK